MKVTEIAFLAPRRARLTVEIPDTDVFHTSQTPRLPRILFRLFPRMALQTCHNDGGYPFHQEAQATEIPHLFEHLILEIQNQVRRGVGLPLSGETHWNWTVDPHGRFYVAVDYDNEMVALGAIRLAECIINSVDDKSFRQIDMAREIARLRDLARLSRRRYRHSAPTLSALSHETTHYENAPAASG